MGGIVELMEFETQLGVAGTGRDVFFQLFVPAKDRHGNLLPDFDKWLERAETLLCECFGGATRPTNVHGLWKNPDTEKIIREKTAIVYSYTSRTALENASETLRLFLHTFGLLTDQGEVAFVVDNCMYGITDYDSSLVAQ